MNRRQALVTQMCRKLTEDIEKKGSDSFAELLDCWYNTHFEKLHESEDMALIDRALEMDIITLEEAQELGREGF